MQKIFNSFTLETFCELAFDYHFDSLTKEEIDPFQQAFETCLQCIMFRFTFPLWKYTPFAKSERIFKKNIDFCDNLIYQIIDQRNKMIENNLPTQVKKKKKAFSILFFFLIDFF